MKSVPSVSVVTPSFNQGEFIRDTIRSVKDQDYPGVEHIVVDGGSTDATLGILKQHTHLRWVSEQDRGQADAINKGFAMATGDILGWLNSDDLYAPGAISAAVAYFLANPDVDVVYGDCSEVDETGQVRRTVRAHHVDLKRLLLLDFTLYQPAFFFRRRAVEKIKDVNVALHLALDYDYVVRAVRSCTVAYLPVTLAAFRTHSRAKSLIHPENFLEEYMTVLRGVFDDPSLPRGLAGLARRAYSTVYLYGGEQSLKVGRYAEARSRFLKSLTSYPNPFRFAFIKAILFVFDLTLDVTWGRTIIGWLRRIKSERLQRGSTTVNRRVRSEIGISS